MVLFLDEHGEKDSPEYEDAVEAIRIICFNVCKKQGHLPVSDYLEHMVYNITEGGVGEIRCTPEEWEDALNQARLRYWPGGTSLAPGEYS